MANKIRECIEAELWDEFVEYGLSKVLVCNTQEEMQAQRQRRKEEALQIAAAALRAAGEFTLAENLLN
ncbi:hypothetical protein QLY43_12980 [Cronobacter dublinensis]|uniref:hypothetical protein n=1 Tax=Cronobacter dublinensis TaxID=413497 RepID=UPI0024AEA357|nr:hypothetical protein [Cronobacter dublinensis]MDI7397596.1 hypothetical protein [Cronobacter dublinensis]